MRAVIFTLMLGVGCLCGCVGETGLAGEDASIVEPAPPAQSPRSLVHPPAPEGLPASEIERARFEPLVEALQIHDAIAEALVAGMELAEGRDDVPECKRRSRPYIAAARALRARAHRLLGTEYAGLRAAAGWIHLCVGCTDAATDHCARMESSLASARSQWESQGVEENGVDAP